MNEQQLNDLLNHADAGAPKPQACDTDITQQAIRLGNRRITVRRAAIGVLSVDAVLAVLFFGWIMLSQPDQTSVNPPSQIASTADTYAQDTEADQPSLEELRMQIALQETVVKSLLARQSAQQTPEASNPDIVAAAQAQADLAAKRLVLTADRMERDFGPNDQSQQLYTNVLANFPDSAWAGIARKRINPNQTPTQPRSAIPCDMLST